MAPIASDAENPTTEPQAEASHLELIDSSYEVIASPMDSGNTQKAILPCYSIEPHTRNACFYPRDNLLRSIGEALLTNVAPPNGPHHDLKTFALCGLGRVGKTELALEFVFAHQSHYDAMFFVHANQSTRLSEEFSQIAIKLGLVTKDEKRTKKRMQRPVVSSSKNGWLTPSKYHPGSPPGLVFLRVAILKWSRDYVVQTGFSCWTT